MGTIRARFSFILFSIALLASVTFAATPWPHEQSDLKPDPRITFGRLENGFRYLVMPHANPAGRVSLHLLVEAGSYHENEDERGLAHFVEHMVFNGSRDFPGDSTIKALQRLGLSFGPDANAYTTMLETGYHFSNVPTADAAALPQALKMLRNIADGALFPEAAVRNERKVILAEARSRAGAMSFGWGHEMEFLARYGDTYTTDEIDAVFSGTRVEERISPMGLERVIERATASQLRAFYDRWYRPERMILAIVGDLDPTAIDRLIVENFQSLRARTAAPTPPALSPPTVFNHQGPHLFVNVRHDLPQAHLTLGAALPRDPLDTANRRGRELPRRAVLSMIADRLDVALKVPAQVEWVLSHQLPGWDLPLLRVATPAEHWQAAAVTLATEVRRARQHGFSSAEVAREIAHRRGRLAEEERDNPNRTATALAAALVFAASRGVVPTSASTEREAGEAALATITPEACLDAARQLWPEQRTSIALSGPIAQKDIADHGKIEAAWLAEAGNSDAHEAKPFPYADFGPPGAIASERYDAALDCWFLQFANGVRFNFKSTKFAVGQVRLVIRFGGGNLAAERVGLSLGVGALFFGGLQELPFEEIGPTVMQMGGRIGEVGVSWSDDSFEIYENVDDKNLPLGLQIATAFFAAPAFRESGEPRLRAMFEPSLAEREQTAAGAADYALRQVMFGGSRALQWPTIAESRAIPFSALRDCIQPQVLNSPMEVTLVGDISRDEAVALVARTLGTLPARTTGDPYASLRGFTPPALPRRERLRFKGNASVGSVAMGWTMPNEAGAADDCRFALLEEILLSRLRQRLRQELGETYSPQVGTLALRALQPATLVLHARVETAPRHVNRVAKAMRQVVEKLAREGATNDELERARQPKIGSLETSSATNEEWLNLLQTAQSKPHFISPPAERLAQYRAASLQEINTLARTLLVANRCCEIVATPK
jgi:zinc protease